MASSASSPSPLWEQLNAATKVSERFVDAHFFRRNGNSAQVPEEIAMLRDAVMGQLAVSVRRPVRTVCEVGFNAGHSAIVRVQPLTVQ